MKKIFVTVIVAFVTVFYSCGPAAEDRVRMDYYAKRNADSIARALDSSLNDPLREDVFKNSQLTPPAITPTAQPTNTTGK